MAVSMLTAVLVLILPYALFNIPNIFDNTYCYTGVTTLSLLKPTASCFTVSSSGRFTDVFDLQDKRPSWLSRVIFRDGFVLPGLWDGHGHLIQYGELLHSVNLFGSVSMDDALSNVRQYVGANPDVGTAGDWIRGVGWDQAAFGRMPVARDLEDDIALKGKYIMLDRIDVHCVWVSQAVLNLLQEPIPDVPGGEVIRNPGLGVFCDNAMDMIMKVFSKPDAVKKSKFVSSAMKELNKVGIVGMHGAGATPNDLEMYESLADGEAWSVRVYAMLECGKRNTFCPEAAEHIFRDDGMLYMRSVKLFADGALGSWGSAMLEPYDDHPQSSGSLLINGSDLMSIATAWATEGYQVNIHAIGDLANRLAISALFWALDTICRTTSRSECQEIHRFRLEHAQIIHPDDQQRMFDAGIIPSIQPTHATSDMAYAEDRLGKTRTAEEAYRMKSFLSLNPVLGSDFPVEPPNPFEGIFAAVTRKSPHTGKGKGGGDEGWYLEEALTLGQALEGFTKGPARGAFLDGVAGVIQEDAFADWIVVDMPLEEMRMDDLRAVSVRETWVAGKQVYSG
ncbi:amidohydrolase 3 [Aulographum hederae CBS 113979]|uniref:Amidohydrolase 3 n=1 Tax=Aulographum hederae CBS 113979 TaxID=1176131 RepID=A0A6G1GL99_9PEZI|nr:amidohydrolase 3 [Aulographum hederae CBS 113979]